MHLHAVNTPLRTFAQRSKRLTPLLAAPAALLLSQGQAKAVLTYNIFESGGNVVIQTNGSLNFSGAMLTGNSNSCATSGTLITTIALICTNAFSANPSFKITGPSSLSSGAFGGPASSSSGTTTILYGQTGEFYIDSGYISSSPIVGSATFNNATLANLGFMATGLINTWTLDGTSESINVFIGPPTAAVPGPLPLLGAGAAFGWSRRLRKRIATPLIKTPQL